MNKETSFAVRTARQASREREESRMGSVLLDEADKGMKANAEI